MAFTTDQFMLQFSPNKLTDEFLVLCKIHGLTEVSDLGVMDESMISSFCEGHSSEMLEFVRLTVSKARCLSDGWATSVVRAVARQSHHPHPSSPCSSSSCRPSFSSLASAVVPQPTSGTSVTVSPTVRGDNVLKKRGFASISEGWQARLRALSPSLRAVTRRMLRKSGRKSSQQLTCGTSTLEEADRQRLLTAAMKCHEVVSQFAPSSRRMREMTESEMQCTLNLQLEVYVSGSTSFKVVEGRARAALSFFVDIKVLSWEIHAPNEWRVAAWVRSKSSQGWSCYRLRSHRVALRCRLLLHRRPSLWLHRLHGW